MHLPVPHAAREFKSSEWIAHNVAMRAKQPLLRGKPPKIGSAYVPPPPRIMNAIEGPYHDDVPRWYEVIGWALALPGFVAVMITLGYIGGF